VDLGTVVPSSPLAADVPDIAALAAPRKLLYGGANGNRGPDAELRRARFERALKAVEPAAGRWAWYRPDRHLDAKLMLEWLGQR